MAKHVWTACTGRRQTLLGRGRIGSESERHASHSEYANWDQHPFPVSKRLSSTLMSVQQRRAWSLFPIPEQEWQQRQLVHETERTSRRLRIDSLAKPRTMDISTPGIHNHLFLSGSEKRPHKPGESQEGSDCLAWPAHCRAAVLKKPDQRAERDDRTRFPCSHALCSEQ